MAKKRQAQSDSRGRRGRRWPRVLGLGVLLLAGALAWFVWPFWHLSGQFGSHPTLQPSRLYGRSAVLRVGAATTVARLAAEVEEAGYRRVEGPEQLITGTFRVGGDWIEVFRRPFPTPDGPGGGGRLRTWLRDGTIEEISLDGNGVASAVLDPPLVASYYGPDLRERRPVGLDELPEDLILAVLAIEDANFLEHSGVSLVSILRAAWVNLREHEVRQGGSTLTQQLVKNLYLSPERKVMRKLREAVLAVLLELRYDKRAILQAYLNEIYWGRSGQVNLMGVGAAAWAWFGKEPAHLTLAESALLAGMIQSPSRYSPLDHPQRARQRRNLVLERLGQLQWIERERLAAASREEVRTARGPLVTRQAPFFADAIENEARRRFGIAALRDAGYVLHATLSVRDQREAEEAVDWGVKALESGWEKDRKTKSVLEAALVSIDPRDGAVLAWVGGRDYGRSQFDRVAFARRQPGSAFKPVVYAAAFDRRAATPATILDDSPFTVVVDRKQWSPRNSDGKYLGRVNARTALEQSLNVPTAKLALQVGLETVVDLAHGMGIGGRIDPFPALALGAMEATPLEVATVYGTLAGGGRRPPVHGLVAVYDRQGKKLTGQPVPEPQRVLSEEVAYLVTAVLKGVLDRGTARSVRADGLQGPLAGKTGTSNDRRDSWFAGYSPQRTTLVWVGYDDNTETRLSGARAALPIWTRFTYRMRPAGGFEDFPRPDGVVRAWIDGMTGGLATDRCEPIVLEYFLRDFAPDFLCPMHARWGARPLQQPEVTPVEKGHPFARWLRMLGRRDGTQGR